MSEGGVYGVISAKTAAGKGHSFKTSFVLRPGDQFSRNHAIVFILIISPFIGRNGLIIPAVCINTVGTIYFYLSVFYEPMCSVYHSLVFILIVCTLGSRKQNDGLTCVSKDQHFDVTI